MSRGLEEMGRRWRAPQRSPETCQAGTRKLGPASVIALLRATHFERATTFKMIVKSRRVAIGRGRLGAGET